MLHVVEGPDGSGKTTFARSLSLRTGAAVLVDPYRQALKERGDAELLQRCGDQYCMTVDAMMRALCLSTGGRGDVILDRYWPTAVVHGRLRGIREGAPYMENPLAWALGRRSIEMLYFVDVPDDEIVRRLHARGEIRDYLPDVEHACAVAAGYRLLRRELTEVGIFTVVVHGDKGMGT